MDANTEHILRRITAAEQDMKHKFFMTILKVGCNDYSTTLGRDKLNEAVDKFLSVLKDTGVLKIPEVTNVP